MQRTILALFVEEPSNPIETTGMDGVGVEVESVQETFGGHTIYTGQAATVSSYEVTTPKIHEDGTISTAQERIREPKMCNWFAVPDANPGFIAFDSSDVQYARSAISLITGGWIEPAVYNIEKITDYLLMHREADLWQIVWSDNEESGTFYPGSTDESDNEPVKRGLDHEKKQVGFRYITNSGSQFVRGTVAESGYCELYSPDHDAETMATWIREEFLRFAGVKNVGSAEEMANGEADFERSCAECERASDELEKIDGEWLCPVCLDQLEEEADGQQTELGQGGAD
jgi:hypothetical protein